VKRDKAYDSTNINAIVKFDCGEKLCSFLLAIKGGSLKIVN